MNFVFQLTNSLNVAFELIEVENTGRKVISHASGSRFFSDVNLPGESRQPLHIDYGRQNSWQASKIQFLRGEAGESADPAFFTSTSRLALPCIRSLVSTWVTPFKSQSHASNGKDGGLRPLTSHWSVSYALSRWSLKNSTFHSLSFSCR